MNPASILEVLRRQGWAVWHRFEQDPWVEYDGYVRVDPSSPHLADDD